MKNKYKYTILVIITIILTLSSCSNKSFSTAEKNANYLSKSIKNNKYNEMMSCFYNKNDVQDLSPYNFENFKFVNGPILDYIKDNNSTIDYEIISSDNTTTQIDFTYKDATEIINVTLDAYLDDVLAKIESGVSFENDESIALFRKYFEQSISNYDAKTVDKTVSFSYVETSNGFLIESVDDDFFDIITSNIFKAYNDYVLNI